jgi:hypothetical protein
MSYSKDLNHIRAGLVNFIGASLQSCDPADPNSKATVVSILVEETLKLAQDENGVLDIVALKPMINGLIFLYKQRIHELRKLPASSVIEHKVISYLDLISSLEETISSL